MKILTSYLLQLLFITVSCNTASEKKVASIKSKAAVTKPVAI